MITPAITKPMTGLASPGHTDLVPDAVPLHRIGPARGERGSDQAADQRVR